MESNELDCPAYLLSHGCYERIATFGEWSTLTAIVRAVYFLYMFDIPTRNFMINFPPFFFFFFFKLFWIFQYRLQPKEEIECFKRNKFSGVVNYLANKNPPNKTKTHGREIRVCIIKKPPIVNQSICCAEHLNWAGHITPFAACQVGKTWKITLRDIIVCVKPNSFVAELKKRKKG
jgi:hypothetical protein